MTVLLMHFDLHGELSVRVTTKCASQERQLILRTFTV